MRKGHRRMADTIQINNIETDKNSKLIDLKLNETSINLMLYDKSTLQAVDNCYQNLEKSNICRESIMKSLTELSKDIQDMGIIFSELDRDISKQWGETTDGL